MNEHPTPPLVLLDTGGQPPMGPPIGSAARTFASIEQLISQIEAIDVREGNLEAFDADGRPLALTADSDTGPISWTLRNERYPDALQERLAEQIRGMGPARLGLLDADLQLDGLLRALWRFEHPKTQYPRVTFGDAD